MFATSRIISALVAFSVFDGAVPSALAADEIALRSPDATGLAFELKPEKVEPGERARLTVALPLSTVGLADVDEETELPALNDDLLLEATDLQVLDRDFRRERDHLLWTFDVVAHKDGKYNLPPLEVRFGPQTFSTETVVLTVKSARAPGDDALRPDYGSVGKPWRWKRWLALLLFVASLVVVWKKSVHRRRLLARLVGLVWHRWVRYWSEPSPERTLRRELAVCRNALESGGDPLVALDRATHAVRAYLARRKETAANAWTTDELHRHAILASEELRSAFRAGDAAKFSPRGTADAASAVRDFLDAATRTLTGPGPELNARLETVLRALRRQWESALARLPGGTR